MQQQQDAFERKLHHLRQMASAEERTTLDMIESLVSWIGDKQPEGFHARRWGRA